MPLVLTVSAEKSAKIWEISENGSGSVIKTLECSTSGGGVDMLVGALWQNDNIVIVSLGGIIHLFSACDLDKPPVLLSGQATTMGSFLGCKVKDIIERKHNAKSKCLAAVEQEIISCGFDNKVLRIRRNGDECGEAEEVDIGTLPLDVSIAIDSPGVALVSTESGVVLLKGSEVVSKLDLGYTVLASAISTDGTEAIVGGQDGKLHIYSVSGQAFNEEAVLEKHRGAISVIQYSPDVSMFASGDLNREAIVWDCATKEVKLDKMLYHTARINCLAWSPNSFNGGNKIIRHICDII